MKKRIATTILTLGCLAGCSSIVSKSEYAVTVASTPSNANFTITNKAGDAVQSGMTPSTITLKSSSGYFAGESYTIKLTKEGYSPKTYTLKSSIDGWYFGNLLFGGLIGMIIIDPLTGAMYNLPARTDISLEPTTGSATSDKTFTIATIDSLTENQKSRLERIN